MKNYDDSQGLSITIILIIIILLSLVLFSWIMPSFSDNEEESTDVKTYDSTTTKTTESKHEYTGYCQLVGTYRNRYVECHGDYDPNAKAKAEAKAELCNTSSSAVSGCTMKYTY